MMGESEAETARRIAVQSLWEHASDPVGAVEWLMSDTVTDALARIKAENEVEAEEV